MERENPTEIVKENIRKRSNSMPIVMPSEPKYRAGSFKPVEKCHVEEPEQKYKGKLDIEEHLEDIITFENDVALFECKIVQDLKPTCTWHKDGSTIYSEDERVSVIKNGAWHRLEIKHVTASDQGLYTIECRHKEEYISIKGHLYVAPKAINSGVFYHNIKFTGTGVIRHLQDLKVLRGETIQLTAKFNFEVIEIVWYKNNEVAFRDKRTTLVNDGPNVAMTVINAKTTDAGIYYAVVNTEEGYLSTFADVEVGDSNEIRQPLPIIDENFPDDKTAIAGEEVRLAAKVFTDKNTITKWYKDSVELTTDDYKRVDYGNNYIGLTITNPTTTSAGCYELTVQNGNTNSLASASMNLSVIDPPFIIQKVCLLRPIHSAVACCGAKVSFDCKFDIEDPNFFYVVWYVGHYKVERTNSLFNVINHGGHFLLYIKKIEPGMAGDVICELRRACTYKKTAMINRTYAHLVIVPQPVIEDEEVTPVTYGKLYNEPLVNRIRLVKEEDDPYSSFDEDEFLLKILYCRLDKNLHFVYGTRGRDKCTVLKVQLDYTTGAECVELSWMRSNESECWFSIDMAQEDGTYVHAGNSSTSRFYVSDPPLDMILVFRISEVETVDYAAVDVIIIPPPEIIMKKKAPIPFEFIDKYETKYNITNEIIGTGTFGNVFLIKDIETDKYNAAKYVESKTWRKRDYILREYHIMKDLCHPKLIQLLGFYEASSTFIFVMEYCWGGELFERIVGDEYMKESDVVGYVKQICEGLQYLHKKGIVHLDLKAENIICISPNSRQVKLIDFGVAKRLNIHDMEKSICGTRDYVAPEIIDYAPISTATDMWSLGVVTYMLLSGNMPFYGDSWCEHSANIARGYYEYDEDSFRDISGLAKDFVDQLLVLSPNTRLSANMALRHPWIMEGPPKGTRSTRMNVMRRNLKSYLENYRHKWQRAGHVVRAAHRLRMRIRPDLPIDLSIRPAPSDRHN